MSTPFRALYTGVAIVIILSLAAVSVLVFPLNRGDFQTAMFAFLGSPDPDQRKYNLQSRYVDRKAATHSEINQNYSGISNKVIDRAFDRAAHTATNRSGLGTMPPHRSS
jgi:hypothetical protein